MKKERSQRSRELEFVCVMMALPVTGFIVFWLIVNINSILFAFQQIDPLTGGTRWTFENFVMFYEDIIVNDTILGALKNTMIFFSANLFIGMPVSYLLCYFLYKRVFGYRFYRFVFYLPSIISEAVLVILFKQIISAKGPIGVFLYNQTGMYFPFLKDSRYALKTILTYSLLMGFGGNIVLLSGAMSQVDKEIIEAARIDGVGLFREMGNIVFPLTWPTFSTLLLFTFVSLFAASGPVLLFTKGEYQTRTISYWIYEQVYFSKQLYYPSAVGLVFTLIGTPIALGIKKINSLIIPDVED